MFLIMFFILLSIFMICMGSSVWQTGGKIGLYILIAGIVLLGTIVYSFITNIVKEIKEKKSQNMSWRPQKITNSFTYRYDYCNRLFENLQEYFLSCFL